MPEYGYFLSCEEFRPAGLVEQAGTAERAGFQSLWISDHYHQWNDEQGESPFVWSVIGAISEAVSLPVETAVTCPTVRIHPAVIAQAAATAAVMTNGRFRLGVGSGEALNEHILGHVWPPARVRLEMLGWRTPASTRSPTSPSRSMSPASARRRRRSRPGWATGTSRCRRTSTWWPSSSPTA